MRVRRTPADPLEGGAVRPGRPMTRFRLKRIRELVRQLRVGPVEVRRQQAERLERLLVGLDPARTYPYEFIYFRVTGFRPEDDLREAYAGRDLLPDLHRALELLFADMPRLAEEAGERVHTVQELCAQFQVTARTVRRWRRRGLVGTPFRFPDGRVLVGVRQSSLEAFLRANAELVSRSTGFSRLSAQEEAHILRLARRHAGREAMSLTGAAARIATELGRAPETVRQFLLKHEQEAPEGALFGSRPARLSEEAQQRVYVEYRQGIPVRILCRRYGRSRASLYRIINRQKAQALLQEDISCLVEAAFSEPDADQHILGGEFRALTERLAGIPAPAEPAAGGRPLARLTEAEEATLFRAHNYLKFRCRELRHEINPSRYVPSRLLRGAEDLRGRAEVVRDALLQLYLPVAEQLARQHAERMASLPDALAVGRAELARLIDAFDYRGRARFQPYASLELMKRFARLLPAGPPPEAP